MNGPTTIITDPSDNDEKKFAFDYSYWSHDGSKEQADGYYGPDPSHPNGKKFCDQKRVFEDIGVGVLKNAWEGYNTTLFAYGQTGSGKSWSIVGYGVNKGVVPMFCEQVFKGIDEKKTAGEKTEFEVMFSMLEIYNEQVRDLLDSKPPKRGGLKVRQHPKKGFYADGLQITPVSSYKEIEDKMEEGTRNRTVAATNMNATSSRAHTIVGMTFIQKFVNAAGEETTKSPLINLVDLAGSERAESTGATGDRLKEGAAINQSLSCLGNVISALADRSNGKNTRVPYRDSCLTKLLKNALGGNSKTIMIAAVSPADINYDESLSTLRYADRAKQIKTTASVNEDPTEKLIRELQEENEKLKAMLGGNVKMEVMKDDDEDLTDEELAKLKQEMEEEYKSRLETNAKEMEEMHKTFEERLAEAHAHGGGQHLAEILEKKKKMPYLSNLNMDPQLSGHIILFIEKPEVTIGNSKGSCDIMLKGPSIVENHAIIREDKGAFSIEPSEANVRMMRNGKLVTNKTELKYNDRLIFGTTQYFVFVNPKDKSAKDAPVVNFEMAQEEIAKKSGFDVTSENKTRDEALLKEDIVELMPAVEECNSISEELDKKMKFELMVVSAEARGELKGRTEVMVRVVNLETKHEWIWPREKFMNRKFLMQEMYQNFMEGEEWDLPKDKETEERDPFSEDYEAEFHIGSVKIWLQSLAYHIEIKEQLDITDFKGQEVGLLNVELIPCDKKGKEYTENDDVFVNSPDELKGKDVNFVVKILSARGLPSQFTDIYLKYLVYHEDKYTCSNPIKNTINPDWNHKRVVNFTKADDELLKYLSESAIMVQIWGKQKPPKTKKSINTKQAILSDALRKGQTSAANTNTKVFDSDKVKYMMKVAMLEKRQQQMQNKIDALNRMLELADQHSKKKISTQLIKNIYHAPTHDQAEKCLKLVEKEKDDGNDEDDTEFEAAVLSKDQPDNKRGKSGNSSSRSSSSMSSKSGKKSKSSSFCVVL
ncbi:kinesin-like protein KIF28P isoform X1 [Patella vulgata]|uniref:kinesin-like protein KIF28P isoform X1 n=1 Tax=Patella vulgata TaxID=6465 RepID=UPI00218050BD|nr:kinesin-like protein KIF28P isoform X1 [Patella vulgata]